MASATGVACDEVGQGEDGGQVTATRAMARMWAVAAAVVVVAVAAAAAAALLMMFPASTFLFSIFLRRTTGLSVLAGMSCQNVNCGFLFEQS